ncbi:unnamed protein product [Eruca vesicaria subsp. sativa]|uniref:Uncharacterized protein n=1 Tax=Eruca vesicaria subsp. sativa TaxID=29727 RepID=A0ABC8JFG4_ERUVS|nr:unnamed protein product [Eruca vesicaria subsp. sativa]
MSAADYVKIQPHLQGKPISTTNQFSALAEFPPLSYAKAVNPTPQKITLTPPIQKTTDQKSTYFLKPQPLPPIQTKQSPTKKPPSPTESTTSSSGSKKSKGNDKLKKFLEAIAMQISSDEEEDITQDTNTESENPYGGPLSQDPYEE